MRKIYLLATVCITLLCFYSSCKKTDVSVAVDNQSLIQSAHSYFNDKVLHNGDPYSSKDSSITQRPRRDLSHTPQWNKARVVQLASRKGVVVPIRYDHPFLIKSNLSGALLWSVDDLSKLFIYQDGDNQFHAEVVTYLPDSSYNRNFDPSFKGIVLVEDWWGNSIARYKFDDNGDIRKYDPESATNSITSANRAASITVCYYIEGYNYAPATGDVYYWEEFVGCDTYFFETMDKSDGGGGGGSTYGNLIRGGGGGAPSPASLITVLGAENAISNILQYNKCFDNIPGNDHTYQITVCVDQPVAGSRQSWGINDVGGTSGTGNPVSVGHTFLIFKETTPTRTVIRNVGFYPKSSVNPYSISDEGVLNNDNSHDYNIALTVTMTSSQFNAALNYINQGNNGGYTYNLNSYNCTTFAIDALAAAGVHLPATTGSWLNGSGFNPGDLGEDIRNMTLPSNMTRTTMYGTHPNAGFCD